MSVIIRAPHPTPGVTTILPSPQFDDGSAAERSVTVKRSMLGRLISYVTTSDRRTLRLTFRLTRMKSLELEAFVKVYYRAEWDVTLHTGARWVAKLASSNFPQRATERAGGNPGGELVEVSLVLSATPYLTPIE